MRPGRRRLVVVVLVVLAASLALAIVLNRIGGDDGLSFIDPENVRRSYFAVFLLVALDAVIPIFPGETTLNAASTAASQGSLDLAPVIVAGALGAIVGDSALFWIARRSTKRIAPQVEKAQRNTTVATALESLRGSASPILVAGRFVPGVRLSRQRNDGGFGHPVPALRGLVSCWRRALECLHLRPRVRNRDRARRLPARFRHHLRLHHNDRHSRHLPRCPS